MNDPLAAALSKLNNAQRANQKAPVVVKSSKMIRTVLDILNQNHYIGGFEIISRSDGDQIRVNLLDSVNKLGVIKPRFSFKTEDYQRVEKQYLPARDFGVIIVSTSQGIMTLAQAKHKNLGGKLIAYCY